ncbi:site-specific recombinase XerD [Streptomyces griseochromogenes]|uniref:Recombinase n=1 Tax=Streptomyces griseochromogenes TaxID=68214 RepID=A0A1B1BD58_9ACTN|nr:site-specific integrase [Streptomyces griseochromogenes]ANP56737.1 recombinase [Streptomyces griseochromogenes]MBP2056474.1 site-specific recombinase XerD [Streptomyces griseochromogenes]
MAEVRLQVIAGGAVPQEPLTTDPWRFHAACVDAFVVSWRARGFSPVTIDNDIGLLERTLTALGRPAWETPQDIDRVIGDLTIQGRKTSTRREYVQIFKCFHRFLQARKAAEIEAAFSVRLVCPIDEFNASRHVGDDSPAVLPPPTPEQVGEFFDFMKQRIATARKYGPAARDHAMFRTLYHAGLRSEEASLLDKPGLHLSRGPFGKLHVRFGEGAHTSGPRPRWVPMLDGLDLVLRWFLEDVRPKFPDSPVLFADESGGSRHRGTIRNRLRYLMELEGRPTADRFSPHALRRACATQNYERGGDLVAIQQLLGHWTVSSTMRYVRPSATFIEDAYQRAVASTLAELSGKDTTA